jgi:hypothetical protein
VAALSLSACGLETKDYTATEKSQVQGAQFSVGPVDVRDAFLTYDIGALTTPYLDVTFINDGTAPETFTGVTVPNATAQLSGPGTTSGLTLPPGVVVRVTDPLQDSTGASLLVTPNTSPPPVGTSLPVTFSFSASGSSAPVQLPVDAPGSQTLQPTQNVPTVQEPGPSESGEPAND